MKRLLYISILLLLSKALYAQCECTDCPIPIVDNATFVSTLDINGASNDDLTANPLCKVCLDLTQDAMIELDIILTAPDGSNVALSVSDVLGFGNDIFYEICFVPCSEPAAPDPGFSDVFDSGNNWQNGTTYTGVYYPQDGCLEDLTGSVNGDWSLTVTDIWTLENGELFDWYLVFADDTGLDCVNAGECDIIVNTCLAEGGDIDVNNQTICEGDSDLILDVSPDFPGGNEPPASEYGYTYIITDLNGDFIVEISPDLDFSSFAPGSYQICGLSFLLDDEGSIPSPNGSLELDDIQNDIDNGTYCADISDGCANLTITPNLPDPILSGPLTVCPGQLVEYEILNYDPSYTYVFEPTGLLLTFQVTAEIVEITWGGGNGELCVYIEEDCFPGTVVCLEIIVAGGIDAFEINGDLSPCPGSIETYDFIPAPDVGENYDVTITGGTILNQTDTSIEVEWPTDQGMQEICIELISTVCDYDPFCVDVEIELGYELPTELNTPDELCLGDIGSSFVSFDLDVISYTWTVSNLTILSGQGTQQIEYEGVSLGTAEVCLEIETDCGMQGPVCQLLEILETPNPEIDEVIPSCNLLVDLQSNASSSNGIEWTLLDGPGFVIFDPDDEANTMATFSEPGIYTVTLTETNGICEFSTDLEITILADLIISNLSFDCSFDNEYTVSFDILSGDSPYFVNGNQTTGSFFISDLMESGEDYFFNIEDAIGCSTEVEGNFECPCLSDAGNMSQDLITSCISDNDLIIAEWEDDGIFDSNDIGTYVLHDSDDDDLGQIFATSEIGEFEYLNGLIPGQTYYISFVIGNELTGTVDLDDPCLSVSFGQPIIFYDLPELNFIVATETCEASIFVDGFLPLDIQEILWIQIDGPGNSTFNTNNSLPTTISVSEQGSYFYEIEVLNQACTAYQELEVNFLLPPVILNPIEECDASSGFYTISVQVDGGEAPYQSNLPGSFVGNIFTSELIPSGEPYTLIITDDFGCSSLPFDGVKLCDCNSDAGVLNATPVELCEGDTFVFDAVANVVLDPNDIGLYFLFYLDQFNNQVFVASGVDPMFPFQNDIIIGVTYFVSYWVGDEVNNTVDVTDPCLDVSNSIFVSWNSFPIVDAGADENVCSDEVVLDATPINGQWEIVSSSTAVLPELSNISDPNAILTVNQPGEYVLEWTSANGNCESSSQVTIIKNVDPEVVNLMTTCNEDLQTYLVSFEIENGAPFLVNGQLATSPFEMDLLDNDVETIFAIQNDFNCLTELTVGPINCECQNEAGTVINNEIILCANELLDPNISNGDFVFDTGDSLIYIIHDGTLSNIGDVLITSFGEEIMLDDPLMANTVYYLTAVIGEFINGAINFADPCLQYSESVPVQWLEENNIFFEGMGEACIGDMVDAEIQVTGSLPVEVTIVNSQGEVEVILVQSESQIISLQVNDTQEQWTIQDAEGDCINMINGNFVISGQEPLDVALLQNLEICNGTDFVFEIELSTIINIDENLGNWISSEIPIQDGIADFSSLEPGDYVLEFSTIGFEGTCPGSLSTTTITVIECICPSFNIVDLSACTNFGLIDLDILDTQGYEGEWTVENINNLDSPPSVENMQLNVANATQGVYQFIYTITQADYPVECDNIIEIELLIWEVASSGTQTDEAIYCQDEFIELNLYDLLEGEDEGGVWTIEDVEVSNIQSLSDLNLGANEFNYTVGGGFAGCLPNETSVFIEVNPIPVFQVFGEDVLCFGDENGVITLEVEDGAGSTESIDCYINDILQGDSKVITGLGPGVYSIYIENEFCQSLVQEIIIGEPQLVSVSLGDDLELMVDDEVVILAITNILESDVDSITWTDLAGILQVDEYDLTSSFDSDQVIDIELIDINGCVAFDQLLIRVLFSEEGIYLPTIFNPDSQLGNETFGILNSKVVEVVNTFNIYDRWGNLVFSEGNLTPTQGLSAWDGRFNGVPAEQGVYVYYIDVTLTSGNSEILVGDITLIR